MANPTAATKLTADQQAWVDGTKAIPSSQSLWECYAALSTKFEYISDFKSVRRTASPLAVCGFWSSLSTHAL